MGKNHKSAINKIVIFATLMFSINVLYPHSISAQNHLKEPYFCTKEGRIIEYERKYADGEIKWYHKMQIIKIDSTDRGQLVTYSSTIYNKKRKKKYDEIKMEALIDKTTGDVNIDLVKTMTTIIHTFLGKNVDVTTSGGATVLPSELEIGDILPDAFSSMKALGMTMNISVTKRSVIGKERLTTPTGTYDCIIIQEHKVEKGMGMNRVTTGKTWYARGMGMIRHDTYNKKGVFETSELISRVVL